MTKSKDSPNKTRKASSSEGSESTLQKSRGSPEKTRKPSSGTSERDKTLTKKKTASDAADKRRKPPGGESGDKNRKSFRSSSGQNNRHEKRLLRQEEARSIQVSNKGAYQGEGRVVVT